MPSLFGSLVSPFIGSVDRTANEFRDIDPTGQYGRAIEAAGAFGRGGEQEFAQLGERMRGTEERLRARAEGRDSQSAEQLRQGLQQMQAGQQSMAAGARPGNQAMAARTAAIQSGRLGAGAAGQQALAGIAERQAAEQSLAQMQQAQRDQELRRALAAQGATLGGYGNIEQLRAGRFGTMAQTPTEGERLLSMGAGLGSMFAGGG
jgi:hypothetical protein